MQVWSLGQEEPLDEGMATHSNFHTWREIPRTEKPSGLRSIGSQSRTQLKWLSMHACIHLPSYRHAEKKMCFVLFLTQVYSWKVKWRGESSIPNILSQFCQGAKSHYLPKGKMTKGMKRTQKCYLNLTSWIWNIWKGKEQCFPTKRTLRFLPVHLICSLFVCFYKP